MAYWPMLSLFQHVWGKIWPTETQYQRPSQSPDCHILNLPSDVLYLISKELPTGSRAILAQTCTALRAVSDSFSPGIPFSAASLPSDEYLRYLIALARSDTNKWACSQCLSLHTADKYDIPTAPWNCPCPLEWRTLRTPGRLGFWPSHRHQHLTLKYTRLDNIGRPGQDHLEKLLSPIWGVCVPNPNMPAHPVVVYEMNPKVVQGRYLLKSTWLYSGIDRRAQSLCHLSKGGLTICEHQRLPSTAYDEMISKLLPQLAAMRWRQGLGGPPCQTEELSGAVARAFEIAKVGTDVAGCCPHCPVDFTVKVMAGTPAAVVRAWYDLGPEGSPMDPAWRVHNCGSGPCVVDSSLNVEHIAGDIRKLYECEGS